MNDYTLAQMIERFGLILKHILCILMEEEHYQNESFWNFD